MSDMQGPVSFAYVLRGSRPRTAHVEQCRNGPYCDIFSSLLTCRVSVYPIATFIFVLCEGLYNPIMTKSMKIAADRVKELLLADGVNPYSVSLDLSAWTWPESGRASTGLSEATVRTYEADAHRVYRLLDGSPSAIAR
jgi:hypothetical protein